MQDIKQTPDGDLDLSSGDLLLAEPTAQHQRDILIAGKGHFKESPTVGVGAVGFLNDNEPGSFLRAVRKEFSKDGMKVTQVRILNGQLDIEAAYEDNNR